MAPLLTSNDYLFVDKRYYQKHALTRGDVVVFQSTVNPNLTFIKREAGLPGEIIKIRNNRILINNSPVQEPYLDHSKDSSFSFFSKGNFGPVHIPKDRFFVLGDNRTNSYDNRNYGTVKLAAIKGRALYIVWATDLRRIGNKISP